jgi:hypothetical protein
MRPPAETARFLARAGRLGRERRSYDGERAEPGILL